MKNEGLIHKVKYLKDVERLNFRQIGQTLGIPRQRCSRLYLGQTGDQTPGRSRTLEPYRQLITEWYSQYPILSATQVFERLRSRQISVSYTSVKRFTRQFRTKRQRCYFELSFGPGEEAQVDWFMVKHPIVGQLAGFAYLLSFSRALFACLLPRMTFEFFIEGHLRAFQFFNGIPRALRYDNLKSVVLRRLPISYNPAFLAFAHFHSFEIRLCNPNAGNEKGRVERAIRTIREGFLSTADHLESSPALSSEFSEWLGRYNNKPHRSTGKPPSMLLKDEKLRALPANAWLNRLLHAPVSPSKTGFLTFDANRYSVPEYLVGQKLAIHAFVDRIEIYDQRENRVASHPRSFERNVTLLNPLHRSFTKVSEVAKAQRIHAVMIKLDPAVARFVELSKSAGQEPYTICQVLFRLIHSHSRAVVMSAVREALAQNITKIQFVQSLLENNSGEEVRPLNPSVLNLSYKPRALDEYSR